MQIFFILLTSFIKCSDRRVHDPSFPQSANSFLISISSLWVGRGHWRSKFNREILKLTYREQDWTKLGRFFPVG